MDGKMMVNASVSIAVPASLVSDVPHLRDKTLKIGLIGRAAAIFGVDQIIVYRDDSRRKWRDEISFISTILSYMETPQYLRRHLFGLRPELRYAGVLPPLRTPHHPLGSKMKDLVRGEFREGVVMTHTRMGNLVDIGVEDLALVRGKKMPISTRLTVKIRHLRPKHLEAEAVDSCQIKVYWGYRVTRSDDKPLGEFLETHHFDLIVATSRRGSSYVNVNKELRDSWMASKKKLLVFGAPTKGLYELLGHEGRKLEDIADFIVNFAPGQKVVTIRTEEAVLLTLGIINILNAPIY
jgi:predicted SPOUT superfamily RNA methylase MTH1